jgi:phosphoribosylformimino-5-aminoimidazole carboxamide ribonucleotide (ProFAR) isomerase
MVGQSREQNAPRIIYTDISRDGTSGGVNLDDTAARVNIPMSYPASSPA